MGEEDKKEQWGCYNQLQEHNTTKAQENWDKRHLMGGQIEQSMQEQSDTVFKYTRWQGEEICTT